MKSTLSRLLIAAAKADPKIMVLTGDHGFSLFAEYRRECQSQFLNCGIAEQNMIGVAAGLAQQGFKPIVYALAAFMPCRVVEQIKLDLCYPKLSVVLLGDGAGMVYSNLGPSHHACEDLALTRSLPNLTIYSPADRHGLETTFGKALETPGPVYIRLGKGDLGDVPLADRIVSEGTDPTILLLATGSMVKTAHEVAFALRSTKILNVAKIKPFASETVVALARGYKLVVTLEEHYASGGLGSAVAEAFAGAPRMPPLLRIGVPDEFVTVAGSWQYLMKQAALDADNVVKRIRFMADG